MHLKNHKCKFEGNRGSEMNTRDIASEYRLSHWAKIARDRKESGLNITAYCRTIGILPNTYFYWQKKLRENVCNEFSGFTVNSPSNEIKTVPTGWAVCETRIPEPNEDVIYIEIGICRVTVTENSAPELIGKVCRVLAELC